MKTTAICIILVLVAIAAVTGRLSLSLEYKEGVLTGCYNDGCKGLDLGSIFSNVVK